MTVPTERDLAPDRHARMRATVLREAATRPRAARRYGPLAAAAGLVAVVGATLAIVPHGDHAPGTVLSGTSPPATNPAPNPTALAARCMGPGAKVEVLFTDRAGGVVVAERAGQRRMCPFDTHGHLNSNGALTPLQSGQDGYASTRFGQHADILQWGGSAAGRLVGWTEPGAFYAFGTVARDTARVTVQWPGRGTAQAAIAKQYLFVRLLGDPTTNPPETFKVTSYDRAGHVLSATNEPY